MAGAIDVAEVPVGVHLLKRVASGRGPTAAATTAVWVRRAPAQAQRRRALASLAPPAPVCTVPIGLLNSCPSAAGLTWWASHRRCARRGLCGSIRRGADLSLLVMRPG